MLNRIFTIVSLVWPAMVLAGLVLPDPIGHFLSDEARLPIGFGLGIATANWIFYRRTRRTKPSA